METTSDSKTTPEVPVKAKSKRNQPINPPPALKSRRTRKPKDKEQLALEKQIQDLRATFKRNRASGSILATILLKRLPRMTFEHEAMLFNELAKRHTAEFPLEPKP